MQRIVIIGTTGSGKTTLGKDLATRMNIPCIDMDELYWQPSWSPRPHEEFRTLVEQSLQGEAWVCVGNYSKVRDISWARADTIIWLDLPFHTNFCRLLRRSLARAWDKKEICNGNTESWRTFFSTNSIIIWFFQSYWKRKKEVPPQLAEYPHLNVIHLKSAAAAKKFMLTLRQ